MFFLLVPASISKKFEREHSNHQCSEYTAVGTTFSPPSLSEYQYLGSSYFQKNPSPDDYNDGNKCFLEGD